MVVRKIIERILEEGQTTITITDTDIPGSLVRTYSNDPDLMPVQLVLTGSTLRIDYEAQSDDKYVAVELVKQGLDIIDNLTSTDTDAALSAKQGKVLKDLVDYITPIRELTELDDVLVTDLTDGDILKYDAEEEKFVNYALPTIPVYLGDLGDIVLDTVAQGQVLTYNGAYWTNADASGSFDLSTTEKVIGRYTDGKPLYMITLPEVSFGTTDYTYTHNLDIKEYISIFGSCTINNSTTIPHAFPFYQHRWGHYCEINQSSTNSITFSSDWNNDKAIVTMIYTKNSDYE